MSDYSRHTKIRRVVTGCTPGGKSVIVSDTGINALSIALAPGIEFYKIWGADSVPMLPDDGSAHQSHNYFPPAGGYRFGLFTVPPQTTMQAEPVDMESALQEAEKKLPGLIEYMEPDNPGMHITDSIDLVCIVSGEIWLELDDDKMVHLCTGDTIVQNGTRHAWRNKSTEPCCILACIIGTQRL